MDPIDRQKAIECLGDEAVFESMVESFLEEVDQMMIILAEAVEAGETGAIKEKAHWVKGGLVYLHAHPAADAAKRLELAAEKGPAEVQAAHQDLKAEVTRLKSALAKTA